jgi:hypothetical protein
MTQKQGWRLHYWKRNASPPFCPVSKERSVANTSFLFFFFFGGTGIWTYVYHFSHTSSPFCSGYFGNGILGTICLSCPWTVSLLISASQLGRITGMSHRHPVPTHFYTEIFLLWWKIDFMGKNPLLWPKWSNRPIQESFFLSEIVFNSWLTATAPCFKR